MSVELRDRLDSGAKWVQKNIHIPSGDNVDRKAEESSLVPTNAFGEVIFRGATRKAKGKVKIYFCV